MNMRSLFATLTLAVALVAVAPPARAQAVDPCTVLTCMAGISGSGMSGGPGCTPAVNTFFGIKVFDPHYDPGATAASRRAYLMSCQPGANVPINIGWVNAIIAKWGTIP